MIFTEAVASEEAFVVSDRTRFLGHGTLSPDAELDFGGQVNSQD